MPHPTSKAKYGTQIPFALADTKSRPPNSTNDETPAAARLTQAIIDAHRTRDYQEIIRQYASGRLSQEGYAARLATLILAANEANGYLGDLINAAAPEIPGLNDVNAIIEPIIGQRIAIAFDFNTKRLTASAAPPEKSEPTEPKTPPRRKSIARSEQSTRLTYTNADKRDCAHHTEPHAQTRGNPTRRPSSRRPQLLRVPPRQ